MNLPLESHPLPTPPLKLHRPAKAVEDSVVGMVVRAPAPALVRVAPVPVPVVVAN